jgi:hypothetical protein
MIESPTSCSALSHINTCFLEIAIKTSIEGVRLTSQTSVREKVGESHLDGIFEVVFIFVFVEGEGYGEVGELLWNGERGVKIFGFAGREIVPCARNEWVVERLVG